MMGFLEIVCGLVQSTINISAEKYPTRHSAASQSLHVKPTPRGQAANVFISIFLIF